MAEIADREGIARASGLNITPQDLSREVLDTFSTIPWCNGILMDPASIPIETISRMPREDTMNSFFRQTLDTRDTVRACQSLYKMPIGTTAAGVNGSVGEMRALLSFGSGLNGHIDIIHGGFLACILDEFMGLIVRVHPAMKDPYTAYVKADFKMPLKTPSEVLCRVWFTKFEGRKVWISGTVENEYAKPYAVGESMYVDMKPKL